MKDSRGGSLTRGILEASLGFDIQAHARISMQDYNTKNIKGNTIGLKHKMWRGL